MSKPLALPCIKCGAELENVDSETFNQPYKGTALSTSGHYGCTVFDSFDGSFIEFNLCDDCLIIAGDQGRVMIGKSERNLRVDGAIWGRQKLHCPNITWNKEMGEYPTDDTLDIDLDDVLAFAAETPDCRWNCGEETLSLWVASTKVKKDIPLNDSEQIVWDLWERERAQ